MIFGESSSVSLGNPTSIAHLDHQEEDSGRILIVSSDLRSRKAPFKKTTSGQPAMLVHYVLLIAVLAGGAYSTAAEPNKDSKTKNQDEQTKFCDNSIKAIASWSMMGLGVVAILNMTIVGVVFYTLFAINGIPSECEKLTSSVHWLNRTAIRSALGPSAKQSLNDYAKSLPELVGLTGEKNIADKKE
ncbi:hypothetical protein PRIPAC_95088 [Pristionchus pacificus]|uniref:Uncharacterized protein n=1 Tax=Pristionchus pacificus TaxID=54126 RepID=A0A2A6BAJ1_PRIPA|nr:hypothetical protein PRIPAC_95088 [Pristionchus pacificus]|eukprot:PDM62905.1 hypothetical protein PRIPAC_50120 [Pristionchus pacificus]